MLASLALQSLVLERSKKGINCTPLQAHSFQVRVGIICNCHSEFFWQGGGGRGIAQKMNAPPRGAFGNFLDPGP